MTTWEGKTSKAGRRGGALGGAEGRAQGRRRTEGRARVSRPSTRTGHRGKGIRASNGPGVMARDADDGTWDKQESLRPPAPRPIPWPWGLVPGAPELVAEKGQRRPAARQGLGKLRCKQVGKRVPGPGACSTSRHRPRPPQLMTKACPSPVPAPETITFFCLRAAGLAEHFDGFPRRLKSWSLRIIISIYLAASGVLCYVYS